MLISRLVYVIVLFVYICGSKRCKTCQHVSERGTFTSNITHKYCNVVSPNPSMDCNTKNVIFYI